MKHIPRFYFSDEISDRGDCQISPQQMFHATKVLRLKEGDNVRIFNNISGEWTCEIKNIRKNIVAPLKLIRKPCKEPGPSIACALINPTRFSIMIEKITELGVQNIYPIITDFTQYKTFNKQKIEQVVIQACEQSKRLTVPTIHNVNSLENFIGKFPKTQKLLVGIERKSSTLDISSLEEKATFLIGPEGGFSDREMDMFDTEIRVHTFYFGRNILRSETAAIAFISCWIAKYI